MAKKPIVMVFIIDAWRTGRINCSMALSFVVLSWTTDPNRSNPHHNTHTLRVVVAAMMGTMNIVIIRTIQLQQQLLMLIVTITIWFSLHLWKKKWKMAVVRSTCTRDVELVPWYCIGQSKKHNYSAGYLQQVCRDFCYDGSLLLMPRLY